MPKRWTARDPAGPEQSIFTDMKVWPCGPHPKKRHAYDCGDVRHSAPRAVQDQSCIPQPATDRPHCGIEHPGRRKIIPDLAEPLPDCEQVLTYLFSGAVNSIQITAPSSTSLSEP